MRPPRLDPAHRRPADRAGAGGRRIDRPPVRGVRADYRSPALGHRIVGLDWETTQLDERLAARTEQMFDARSGRRGRRLLDKGLRDGVTASRALGYAQVIAALDNRGETYGRPRADVRRDQALRAPAAVVVPARSPHPLARWQRANVANDAAGMAARILSR